MPLTSTAPHYSQQANVTRDSVAGLKKTSGATGYNAYAVSDEKVAGIRDVELDFVINSSAKLCIIGLIGNDWSGATNSESQVKFGWRFNASNQAQVMESGVAFGVAQTYAAPVAARILIINGVVTYRFGNGADALVYTSTITPQALAMLYPFRLLALFSDLNAEITPITFAGDSSVFYDPLTATIETTNSSGTPLTYAARTVEVMYSLVPNTTRPRPSVGKTLPRMR
jgi:hypothetical protein